MSPAETIRFPSGFHWGAGTSAHQVEGGNRWNDWWRFEQRPGVIRNGDRADRATAHYELYEEDFARAAADGHDVHRLSIEWSRIEPERGRVAADAVAHYHDVFRALRRHRLEPIVTLHHFTNPLWIADGGNWEERATVDRFCDFVGFCAREFGAEVDWWCTVNEPEVFAFRGWSEGVWPPSVRNNSRALAVMAHQLEAHGRAYRILHELDRTDADGDGHAARVGFAKHVPILEPLRPWFMPDVMLARFENRVFNDAVIEAPISGRIDLSVPGARRVSRQVHELAGSLDWMGLNYYTRWKVRSFTREGHVATPGAPVSDLGWEVHPAGIASALEQVSRTGRPLIVLENGVADAADRIRPRMLVETLIQVARAIQRGLPVIGYVHWSLLDNFEWADGYQGRFGLYRVDFSDPARPRTRTRSADLFARIVRANAIPPEVAAEASVSTA